MNHKFKPKILYVDDEEQNLSSFRSLFRRKYQIFLALSGQEALQILKENEIQILITDQRMPEMSGSDLLKQASKEYPELICFMLTGYSDITDLIQAVNSSHLHGYLTKPLNTTMPLLQT